MLKSNLYKYCVNWAEERINSIKQAIDDVQESANSETKSTAGDKHDTARAMLQLDVEQKSSQLNEAQKLLATMQQFSASGTSESVTLGSLVQTNGGNYYLSIGAGKIELEGEIYFAVSPISPIAQAMTGKKTNESFEFNGKKFTISQVI